ncbi:MAG: PHB depolymerase family esterase [Bacillota bacterium]
MEPILKTLERAGGRSLYICFPPGPARSMKRTSALIVLRDHGGVESVKDLLGAGGTARLCEEWQVILAFPNPIGGRWNWTLTPSLPDDIAFLEHIQNELDSPAESVPFSMALAASSNPLKDERFYRLWHPMADVRYIAGMGTGASMACALAALRPQLTAAVFAENGTLSPAARAAGTGAPVPAFLLNCPQETAEYFLHANGATKQIGANEYCNPLNPCQRVFLADTEMNTPLPVAYDALMRHVRQVNTSVHGDAEPRLLPGADDGFTPYADDDSLADGLRHTWLVHVPKSVREHPDVRVPLMVFFHGAGDNPLEAADMTKFHMLGERDGFVTVYPWGANRMTWNSNMVPDEPDDDAYAVALIRDMIHRYPIDSERVYLSGFSNGAAQAHAVAMCHPDLIAAICPIDANWPGTRMGVTDITWRDVAPMRIGMEKKQEFDYRMPVWYTYGGREISYPVYNGSTQQKQYDFWKMYNNIPIKPTPPKENPHPCGCGAPGDIYERLAPSAAHPEHAYDVHRFLSADADRPNLYNYVVMPGKGHEIAPTDAELGWRYVRQFRRRADGSLDRA